MSQSAPAQSATVQSSGDIVAKADFQYRWRVYAFSLLLIGYGLWSDYDGFVNWPAKNAQWSAMLARGETPPRTNYIENDILLNRRLGIAFPAVGLVLLTWLMYRSRGAYRLAGNMLHVPGHGPSPRDTIKSLDKSRWDRKGVAVVEYELPDGRSRSVLLRDMVYQRAPTDQIVARIESHLSGPAGA